MEHFAVIDDKGEVIETHRIPKLLIEEGTYLHGLTTFPGKKNTIDIDGVVYYLLDWHPKLESFLIFLFGGDFDWDNEAMDLFDFYGYRTQLDYPLEFQKIKLRDDWIRRNFYRLELSNPESKLVDLMLERGPYVGLIDMTSYFDSRLVSFKRRRVDNLKVLNRNQGFKDKTLILAGGSLITLLLDDRISKDYDFFVIGNEEEGNRLLDEFSRQIYLPLNYRLTLSDHYSIPNKVIRTANAITFKIPELPKAQIILRLYQSPSEVVYGFDLDASGILYDGDKVWATYRAYHSITHRVNYFDYNRMSPSYGYRLAKYASRGFETWLPEWDQTKVNIDPLIEITQTERRGGPEYYGLFPNMRLHSDDVTLFKSELQKKKLLDNPIDQIIVASYFQFIPALPLSDYDVQTSTYEKRFVVEEKIKGTMIGEYYADKGFSLFIRYENDQPVGITLPKEVAEKAGLPEKVRWNSHDPMTQLTGTFDPTTLSSINEWYKGSKLYRN